MKEYQPYGEEWKKEMRKFSKDYLIHLLACANVKLKRIEDLHIHSLKIINNQIPPF